MYMLILVQKMTYAKFYGPFPEIRGGVKNSKPLAAVKMLQYLTAMYTFFPLQFNTLQLAAE